MVPTTLHSSQAGVVRVTNLKSLYDKQRKKKRKKEKKKKKTSPESSQAVMKSLWSVKCTY